jgi:hypothetical protein
MSALTRRAWCPKHPIAGGALLSAAIVILLAPLLLLEAAGSDLAHPFVVSCGALALAWFAGAIVGAVLFRRTARSQSPRTVDP